MSKFELDSISKDRLANAALRLFAHKKFAYVVMDHEWNVIETFGALSFFGLPDLKQGDNAQDQIDFLIGLDSRQETEMAIMTNSSEKPASMMILPDEKTTFLALVDVSREFAQREYVQQKANDTQLLLDTQYRLTKELEQAQSELVTKNEQLKESTRLQNRFLSGVSHEFRTPLTSIVGYIDLSLKQLNDKVEGQLENHLLAVKRSSKHLLSLVENLLDHGKFDSGEFALSPTPTDLSELVADVNAIVSPLASAKQIDTQFNFSAKPNSKIFLDDSRLRQVFLNLIGNAIKFTEDGKITVDIDWNNDQLNVSVKDTGIGIKHDHLLKVKQAFWQAPKTGQAGTGLGLTITENILEMMGGELSLNSVYGEGTEVRFSLLAPEIDNESQHYSSSQLLDFKQESGLHFLLAEDDDDIAELMMLLLEEQGVEITRVSNGQEAVSKIDEAEFDLVLMDLHMPVLDGYKASKKIKKQGDTPILVMTASENDADRQRAQEFGCDGFLVKPVDINEVMQLANLLVA